jgi:hypothetical protein
MEGATHAANTGIEWHSGKMMNDERAKALIERYHRDQEFMKVVEAVRGWVSLRDIGTIREAVDCVEVMRKIDAQIDAEKDARPAFQFTTEDDFTLKLHSETIDQCCGTCLHWVMRDERCAAKRADALHRGLQWRFDEGWECPHWRRASQGLIESRRRWHESEQPGAIACASCDHWRPYGDGFGRCNLQDRDRSAGAGCDDWKSVTQTALNDEAAQS